MEAIMSVELEAYLRKWFATSTTKMAKKAILVDLTFDDWLEHVIKPRQLKSLQRAFDTNSLNYRQNPKNDFAYVLTWESYAARSTNVYNKDTAIVCTRKDSESRSKPKQGDILRPSHRAKLSKARSGKKLEQATKDAISSSLKGRTKTEEHKQALRKPKAGWSEERKAARKALLAAKARGANQ